MATIHAHRGEDLKIAATTLSKRRGSLRDAALLQVLLTWARLNPEGSLDLTSKLPGGAAVGLAEACDYSSGLALMAVCGAVKVNGEAMHRGVALAAGRDRIEATYRGNFDSLLKGRTVDLLCVSGAERQYIKPLFRAQGPRGVKDKYDLKPTVRGLASLAGSTSDFDEETVSALATLTHELFENTQEHATTDWDGSPYRRHVELLTASWVVLSDEAARNDLLINSSLADYWKSLAPWQVGDRQVAGVCFSFLDSGPGMASRLLGRAYHDLSAQEEEEALRNCLRRGFTSKREDGTGGGYRDVLTQVASASGFVRVRSGRLALFRAFSPGVDHANVCEDFQHWYQDGRTLHRVAGSLISVFIPFPRPVAA